MEHGVKDDWSALARAFSAFIHKSRPELLFDKDESETAKKSETPRGSMVAATDPTSPTPTRGRSRKETPVVLIDNDEPSASGIKPFGKRLADNGLPTPRKRPKPNTTAPADFFGAPESKRRVFCSLDNPSRHADSRMHRCGENVSVLSCPLAPQSKGEQSTG